MANQFLSLSLFIMLLSFFIILNAISTFEVSKSRPVLNSLNVAFSQDDTLDIVAPGQTFIKSQTYREGSTLDKVAGLFQAQITGVETKQNRLGTTMYVRMPFKDFSKSVASSLSIPEANTALSPTKTQDFVPLLVSLLETQRSVPYKMDMVLNIEEKPALLAAENPERFMSFNSAISAISAKIEETGLPKRQISAGLKHGEAGIVELMFRRYVPFNPLRVNAVKDEGVQ